MNKDILENGSAAPFADIKKVTEEAIPAGGIGADEIKAAYKTLRDYKNGKTNLENRIVENEEWWKIRHSLQTKGGNKASAWLFNSITAKHADAMDNIPTCNLLPREESDTETAASLSTIIPVVLERNHFERTYSDAWYDKLKSGTACYSVFWNNTLDDGLGNIDIRHVDILNLFWEPGITDIQKSRNIFHVELRDNDLLEGEYPQLKGRTGAGTFDVAKYMYDDNVDTSQKSMVIDWYYKKLDGSREVLHYAKFVGDVLLYASENDSEYRESGFYDHGKYPFVFDVLFGQKGTPCGFGYVDVMKQAQEEIDALNNAIMENAKMSAKRRFFVRADGSVNEKEYADWDKSFVHYTGSGNPNDSIMPIDIPALPGNLLNVLEQKIQELKETSGTNDFSQGNTTSGVTAYSAIAALQEAGSKTSRDMIKRSYCAFEEVIEIVIELIRQFYTFKRRFRITGKGGEASFIGFDNKSMQEQPMKEEFGQEMGNRLPIFDIKVKAQKQSPFSRLSQNELGVQFYNLGIFNPQMADQAACMLEMMDFEGKDAVIERVQRNSSIPQLMQTAMMLAAVVAKVLPQYGGVAQQVMQLVQSMGGSPLPNAGEIGGLESNALGDAFATASSNSTTAKAADRAAEMAAVK